MFPIIKRKCKQKNVTKLRWSLVRVLLSAIFPKKFRWLDVCFRGFKFPFEKFPPTIRMFIDRAGALSFIVVIRCRSLSCPTSRWNSQSERSKMRTCSHMLRGFVSYCALLYLLSASVTSDSYPRNKEMAQVRPWQSQSAAFLGPF